MPGAAKAASASPSCPTSGPTRTHLLYGQPGHETAFIQGNVPLEQTLNLYRQLWADHLADPESQVETGVTWGQNFLAGKIGMMPLGYGPIAAAPASFRSQIGMTLLPAPSGGATATFDGGANFGIPTGSKNPSGAWEFIKFALQQAQQSLAPNAGFEPIRSDVATPQFRANYPFAAAMLDRPAARLCAEDHRLQHDLQPARRPLAEHVYRSRL